MEKTKRFNLIEYLRIFNKDVILSYKGPFDKDILAVLGHYINQLIAKNPRISKKVFSIFIELAQNISFYSAEVNILGDDNQAGVGNFVIAEYEEHYMIITGNIVKNEDIIPVIDKCEVINSLDRDGLRKYKREQRNRPQGDHGTGNIGLIQVALTSDNPLDIKVTPIDDETSFFSLSVKIRR